MNKIIIAAVLAIVVASPALAGTMATSSAQTQALSSAANQGVTNATTISSYGAAAPDHLFSTVLAQPSMGTPSSAFGWSPNNCGASTTKTVSTPIVSWGKSDTHGMFECNRLQTASAALHLGLPEVARLVMFCFGADYARMAYEASGHVCPSSATAKGIPGAPVGPKFAVALTVPQTLRGTFQPNGRIKWKR